MAKDKKTVFFCQNCGYESPKWLGQCPACKQWNTMVEETFSAKSASKGSSASAGGRSTRITPVRISEVSWKKESLASTKIEELDRVLGGGIVPGALILVGGDPGIGKSTLLLQVCHNMADDGRNILYVSGEESLHQIKMRSLRIGEASDNLKLLCDTDMTNIRETIEKTTPDLVIIDSIQTMYNEEVSSSPGSVSQVRESTAVLLQIAKQMKIPVFIVGHVTKDGSVAGPRVLEHMVDTVLYFEGDRHASYRILRAVKNRFGSTNEIGVFEMRKEGLAEVKNPSEYMLDGRPTGVTGSVVTCLMEGTRPVMIEIQALVSNSSFGNPRRTTNGADYNRVNMLMAVLEKRAHMRLSVCDAYVNITGGVRMNEPAADLAIIIAIASSHKEFVSDEKTVIFGAVGLSGEIRSVSLAEQRVSEAVKLGFETVILPKSCMKAFRGSTPAGIRLVPVADINEALKLFT